MGTEGDWGGGEGVADQPSKPGGGVARVLLPPGALAGRNERFFLCGTKRRHFIFFLTK